MLRRKVSIATQSQDRERTIELVFEFCTAKSKWLTFSDFTWKDEVQSNGPDIVSADLQEHLPVTQSPETIRRPSGIFLELRECECRWREE